ncbi:sensor histidine kinase [Clostridium ihumii]|uniref:sensor histidine kinase n=1 Tax=Clostridium ihumii TaxID=1470356 RepID=UPI003D333D3E
MKKNISLLLFIMSIFAAISTIFNVTDDIIRIINISFITIICILEVIKNISKLSSLYIRIITIIQLIITILSMVHGFSGFEYIVVILIFEILNHKINPIICTIISLLIPYSILKENIFNITIYTIIILLYLYEVKKQHINNEELKEFNKGQRYERHIMEEKIRNLEKYLEQNNITASLRERNFIAQKIHDHLGHRITSSLLQLEVTKETLGTDNELSKKYLISAMENLRDGMEEIRKVLKNIKPRDKVMAIEDIKEELLNFEYTSGIKTKLRIEGNTEKIKLNFWIIIEENLKEALTNIAKYSNATEVIVSFYIYNKIARIEIHDNGEGCLNLKKGLGIRGMEERMQGIGGRLNYKSENGFVINMMLNLGGV